MRFTTCELSAAALAAVLALAGPACTGSRGDPGPAGPAGPAAADGGAAGAINTAARGQNLAASLTAARVTSDGHLQVDYALADAEGAPVAATSDLSNSWVAGVLGTTDAANGSLPAWQSLVMTTAAAPAVPVPTSESKGTVEDLGGGKFRYTFDAALPAGYDKNATYRVGLFSRRPLPGVTPAEASTYDIANAVLDFVPAGGTAAPHDMVSNQACNTCHGIIQAHGGFRRETRLCAVCHTTQLVNAGTTDTADPSQPNVLDFGRMTHRIHMGKALPSVVDAAAKKDTAWSYGIASRFAPTPPGKFVYGGVCPDPAKPGVAGAVVACGVGFPQDIRNCAACHAPQLDPQGNAQYATQANDWQTSVSRRTCQGCHDSSWFANGTPPVHHVVHQQASNPGDASATGLPLADDTSCKGCHPASGSNNRGAMVQGHTAPLLSSELNPITLKIPSAIARATSVAVTVSVANADGTPVTDLSTLDNAAVVVSCPTTPDYSVSHNASSAVVRVQFAGRGSTAPAAGGAPGTYVVTAPLPAGVAGSTPCAAGAEARRVNAALTVQERRLGNLSATASFEEFALNPVAYFNASGTGPAPARRTVVTIEKCNACHGVLSLHGGLRHNPEYCAMCHAPDATDVNGAGGTATTGRPTGAPTGTVDLLAARSIHLKPMIHQIHTGEELQVNSPYIIYGFGSAANALGEVRYPGTRANCAACHQGATYTVDSIPAGAPPTVALQTGASTRNAAGVVTAGGVTETVGPVTSACVSCHDSPSAHAHAKANTLASGGAQLETCSVCHGESSRAAPVGKVHAAYAR